MIDSVETHGLGSIRLLLMLIILQCGTTTVYVLCVAVELLLQGRCVQVVLSSAECVAMRCAMRGEEYLMLSCVCVYKLASNLDELWNTSLYFNA